MRNKEIIEIMRDIQDKTTKIDVTLDHAVDMLKEHDYILHGDSKDVAKGGLIADVRANTSKIKTAKGIFATVYAAIATTIHIAIAYFID